MSLDLYVKSRTPIRHRGTGVFIRDNGQTRELKTIEEVKAHFPDCDLSDVKVFEYENDELFRLNLTHNLTEMASHALVYENDETALAYDIDKQDFRQKHLSAYYLLWHPEKNGRLDHGTIHHKDEDGEEWLEDTTRITPELLRQLLDVYNYICAHADELRKYNPDNGWGTYEQLRDGTRQLLQVLLEIPEEEREQYYIYCWT